MPSKRIVMCFDGTWNEPETESAKTNVIKMMRSIPVRGNDDALQVVLYDEGVGTEGTSFSRSLSGAVGLGVNENIRDGYRAIANNFEDGDEIYIFGYSRGAYTARSLAGLISTFGLLRPVNLDCLMDVWDVYRRRRLSTQQKNALVDDFVGTPDRPRPDIECIGVWDTVGALGVPTNLAADLNQRWYGFHDTQLGEKIKVALHAVSIDDRRGQFLPTLWESPNGRASHPQGHAEQVWFPGGHSGVGGGYVNPDEGIGTGLPDGAFDWMARRATALTGLTLAPVDYAPNPTDGYYDELGLLYSVSHVFPAIRTIGGVEVDTGVLDWIRGDYNVLKPIKPGNSFVNECIHVSALRRLAALGDDYEAPNLRAALGSANCPPVVDESGDVMPPETWRGIVGNVLD